jgi:hypothetical protein
MLIDRFRCLCLVNRRTFDDDDRSTLSDAATLRLANGVLPHADDTTCLIIAARSLTSSIRTPCSDRSRTNSIDINDNDHSQDSLISDLIVF